MTVIIGSLNKTRWPLTCPFDHFSCSEERFVSAIFWTFRSHFSFVLDSVCINDYDHNFLYKTIKPKLSIGAHDYLWSYTRFIVSPYNGARRFIDCRKNLTVNPPFWMIHERRRSHLNFIPLPMLLHQLRGLRRVYHFRKLIIIYKPDSPSYNCWKLITSRD